MIITPPEGYEIDEEKSTLHHIVFKKKESVTYKEVAQFLFKKNTAWFLTTDGKITHNFVDEDFADLNNCTSEKQAEKVLAFNKLLNVAKYLNGDWKPNWNDNKEDKYRIAFFHNNGKLVVLKNQTFCEVTVYFKSEELAYKAINILGEDTIKLVLSTDW